MADLEDVKFWVKVALLSEEFKAVLDKIWAEKAQLYDDQLAIYYPQEVFTSQKWDMQPMFPYGELNSPISRNLAQQSSYLKDLGHEVQIFWHMRHDDEEELVKYIERYLRATRDYFEAHHYLDSLGNAPITLNDDVYSPFVPATVYEGRPFVKSGMLTIYVRTLDDVSEIPQ